MNDAVVVGIAAGVAVVLVIALFFYVRARRALVRRVTDMALRLEDHTPATEHRTLDRSLSRLERAVDSAVLGRGEATVAAGRLSRALEAIPQGVVICDENVTVVFRNGVAAGFTAARHGDAIVAAAIEEMLHQAVDGAVENRTLELFGP